MTTTPRLKFLAETCRRPAVWSSALAFLVVSIGFLKTADVVTARTRSQLAEAQGRLVAVEIAERAASEKARQVSEAKNLLSQSADAGFLVRNWDARRFNLKQVSISRESMNALLSEVSRSPERYFGAEQFEVSVKRQDESLFLSPVDPSSELLVTLRGSLYFKARRDRR